MGYAGGLKKNPTYRDMGDHSEAVQIDYDPGVISYAELLDVFWKNHDPSDQHRLRQYMNILFYHNQEQKEVAEQSRDRIAPRLKGGVATELLRYRGFTRAEDYHQKFSLQRFPDLMREIMSLFPETGDLVDSTAVARINGYLGGNGTCDGLKKEIQHFGLSALGERELMNRVCGYEPLATCGTGSTCSDHSGPRE